MFIKVLHLLHQHTFVKLWGFIFTFLHQHSEILKFIKLLLQFCVILTYCQLLQPAVRFLLVQIAAKLYVSTSPHKQPVLIFLILAVLNENLVIPSINRCPVCMRQVRVYPDNTAETRGNITTCLQAKVLLCVF